MPQVTALARASLHTRSGPPRSLHFISRLGRGVWVALVYGVHRGAQILVQGPLCRCRQQLGQLGGRGGASDGAGHQGVAQDEA